MAKTIVDTRVLFLGGNNIDDTGKLIVDVSAETTYPAGSYVVLSATQTTGISYELLDDALTGVIQGVTSEDITVSTAGTIKFNRAFGGHINVDVLNDVNTTQYDAIPVGGTDFVRLQMEAKGFVGKSPVSM